MPYIGRDLNRGNYLKLDDISSSFDSSTTTFNLTVGGSAFTPGSAFAILVSVGGVIQEPESAYQVNNSEITFANAPTAQDSFFCIALGVSLGIGVPGSGTVNGPQMAKPFNYDGFFYLDDANNRVGINSSAPKVALDVNGNAKISGILTAGSYSGPISNPSGISTFYDVRVTNNLTVEGSTTTLDTDLIGVDRVEVAANSNSIVGVAITQSGTADIINLFDGNTEVLTVIDGGKVGIGTANPTELIDVLSTSNNATIQVRTTGAGAWFEADSASSGYSGLKLSSGGTQRWLVGSFATNNFTIKDGGTSGDGRFTIVDGTGNIGIGTDAPDTQLEVFGGSTSIQVGNQSGSGRFGADGTSTKIGSHSNHHLDLFTNGVANTRLRIDSNGRVLINTTNNSNGHIAASNLAVQGGDFTIFKDSGGDNADVSGHKLKFVTQSGSIGEIDVLSEGGGGPAGRGGAMRFYTKANNTSSADEKLRITSDGYIKVSGDQGNSDYWGKIYNRSDGFSFHAADGSVARNITFYSGAATSTERLRIESDGDVNIKGGNLHVGTDSATANFTDSNGGNTKHIEIGATGGGDALFVAHASGYGVGYFGYEAGGDRLVIACDGGSGNNKIDFITDAGTSTGGGTDNLNAKAPKMRITSGGDIVLGHNAANARLHIASGTSSAVGDATNPALQIGSTTNYRFAVHTTSEQAIIANKNGDDGIAFHTKTANNGSFGEALRITANGDVYSANSAYNTYDNAATNVNTICEANENRSGVYWLDFNGVKFRAYVKPNWLQGRNWVLAAKYFDAQDMPSGSSLWTNDTYVNESDFNLYGGIMSKYRSWRYFSFNRLAMQMGNRIPPIMQFNSNQTLFGAFSGGRANNGGGVTANSTDPAMSGTSVRYHDSITYAGPDFEDVGGSEDRMQSYGLNKWANTAINSTSANNQGSENYYPQHRIIAGGSQSAGHSLDIESVKGFRMTIEDSHPNLTNVDSVGRAGAWIGCPLDEGNSTQGSNSSNAGADSGFGLGGGSGNNARTWTSGYAEWGLGNSVVNCLPAYIWLSID